MSIPCLCDFKLNVKKPQHYSEVFVFVAQAQNTERIQIRLYSHLLFNIRSFRVF